MIEIIKSGCFNKPLFFRCPKCGCVFKIIPEKAPLQPLIYKEIDRKYSDKKDKVGKLYTSCPECCLPIPIGKDLSDYKKPADIEEDDNR